MGLSGFQALAVVCGLTALCGTVSVKFLKMRGSLGMASAGAVLSLAAYAVGAVSPAVESWAHDLLVKIDFKEAVFHGMLCFLLFAGAMHVDLRALRKWGWHVGLLATIGVVISTFVVAGALALIAMVAGVDVPFIWLLVFGALISPTDPIAVLALLKEVGAPKDLETKIAAESLFNDGTGVVLFSVLLAMTASGFEASAGSVGLLFLREAGGGIMAGLVMGLLTHKLLMSIDEPATETAITISLAVGLYALAESFHVSAPLAVAVAGLVVGNGKKKSMSTETREKLIPFWEMFDELLNMSLFALVGLAMMATQFSIFSICAGLAMTFAALAGRFVSIVSGLTMLKMHKEVVARGTTWAMTWGGLRGGLSLAMAMSLPEGEWKEVIVTGAWCAVMISLLVQAPTMKPLLKKFGLSSDKE